MSIREYQQGLRSAVRGLWNGSLDRRQFSSSARSLINRQLTVAWDNSAAECGVLPDEFTEEEFLALGKAIQSELSNIPALADRVQENSKVNGGKLTPLLNRISGLWVNRYRDLTNQAKTMVCKDQKLEWVLGATEQHCRTCPKLNGKVKRASAWKRAGIRPQNPPNNSIECGGWECLCELRKTNKPISRGPLPRFK